MHLLLKGNSAAAEANSTRDCALRYKVAGVALNLSLLSYAITLHAMYSCGAQRGEEAVDPKYCSVGIHT